MQIIYFLLIIIYQYQSLILSGESKLNLVSLFGILGISFFYLIKTVSTPAIFKTPIIKPIVALLILFIFFYLIKPNGIDTVKNVMFVLVSFFPVYFWTITKQLSFKKLRYFAISILVFSFLRYFEGSAFEDQAFEMNKTANNMSYTFILLIPLIVLLFWDSKKSLILILGLIFVLTLLGLKRGAVICLFGSTIIIIFNLLQGGSKKNLFRNLGLLICILSIISFYVYYLYKNNEYMQLRFLSTMAGESSGRDVIYSKIFYSWYDSKDIFHRLFGGGIDYSIATAGLLAHNDWLEILSSMGVLGVVFYLILFLNLLSLPKRCNHKSHRIAMYVILFSFPVMSMFSMFLYSSGSYLFMIAISYISAKQSPRRLKTTL